MKNRKTIVNSVIAVVVAIIVFVLISNSIYTLDVEHAAVVTTFGQANPVTESGLHFKIPFVQDVIMVDTTIRGIAIGYDINTNNSIVSESTMITSDYNFINIDFYLEYQVSDPVKYAFNSEQPVSILKSVTQNCIRTVIASYPVDSVLTTGKGEIQANVKSMLTSKMDELDIGIIVRNITIQDAEPPTLAVNEAFKAVETAKQNKDTKVNTANKYRNEQIPAAKAQVDKIMQDAEATKAERIAEAMGQVARFNAMYNEYVKFPEITRERMFFEAMEEILPDLKIIITTSDSDVQTLLPLESFGNIINSGN